MKLKRPKLKKKTIIIMGIVFIVVVGFGLIKARGAKSIEIPAAMETQITKGHIEESISKTGYIESKVFKEVRSNKSGTIAEVYVQDDQNVLKGEKILKINYDEGTGTLSESSFNILQLRKDYNKYVELGEKYDIKAPFKGVIKEAFVEEGDYVTKGTELVKMIDKSKMKAAFQFTENNKPKIAVGDSAEVYVSKYLSTLQGKVTKISEVGYGIEIGVIVYDIEIEFDNPGALNEGIELAAKVIDGNIKIPAVNKVKAEYRATEVIKSEVEGEILSLNVKVNQLVNDSQIIVKVEKDDYKDTLKMKKINLDNAIRTYEENEKRYDTNIYAPVDGTVIDLNVVSGENINAETVIAKVADMNNYQITVPIDELNILKVKVGQKANIKVNAVENVKFTGTIQKVFRVGKESNGNIMYNVVIALDSHEAFESLRIGMNAKVKVVISEKQDILKIPNDYIQKIDGKYFVNLITETGESNQVEVQLGLASTDFVEITGDVSEGDVVVK